MKKTISTLLLLVLIFTLGLTSVARAETVWLSDAVDAGGFGNCYYWEYTDIDGDGIYDSQRKLHGHWSGGVGGTCVLGRVSIEQDSTGYSNGIFTALWNMVLNAIQTGKATINK